MIRIITYKKTQTKRNYRPINKSKKKRIIVFIHGKGVGILKSEIIKAFKRDYKHLDYQDASFQEYGYGATMVIIK